MKYMFVCEQGKIYINIQISKLSLKSYYVLQKEDVACKMQ
jgi:hypothetical protein